MRCDLSPTGKNWGFEAFIPIARMIGPGPIGHGGWLFTPDVLELDDLEMEIGISIARSLVDFATAGRFIPADTVFVGNPHRPVVPPPGLPMERSDWRHQG